MLLTSLHSIELFKQAINRTQEVLQDTSGIPANFGAAKASENLTEMMHQGLISLQSIQATNQQKTTDDDPNIRFWFPTFFGLVKESACVPNIWITDAYEYSMRLLWFVILKSGHGEIL